MIIQKEKQAENGLQLRSGYHGLSWTVMDDSHAVLGRIIRIFE